MSAINTCEELSITPKRTRPYRPQTNGQVEKRGVYKGRPRTLESEQIRSVRNAALAGTPKVQIAREHGISRSMLYRYLEQPELPL